VDSGEGEGSTRNVFFVRYFWVSTKLSLFLFIFSMGLSLSDISDFVYWSREFGSFTFTGVLTLISHFTSKFPLIGTQVKEEA
jgi:hypothetical protein